MKTCFLMVLMGVIVGLVGCTGTTRVLTAEELAALPRWEGYNMLSIHVEPWKYEGSDEQWDWFRYAWFDREHQRHTRTVKMRRGLVSLPMEQKRGAGEPVVVEPVLKAGKIVGFQRKKKTRPDTRALERMAKAEADGR